MDKAEYRSIRLKLGLSQSGLARLVGVTRETVNKRESGLNVITQEAELAIINLKLNIKNAK
jgi:DNA-binding XRE family transcriptional regulator